jgi:hypothetical protein
MWQELQVEVDQLPPARLKAWGVLLGRGESDHRPSCCSR